MTQASAKIVLDSISPDGVRLTTFQIRNWRPIHSETMTHRVFSRNAGSSRARPAQGIIDQVLNDPWGPIHWGKNQPGMQAAEQFTGTELMQVKALWHDAAASAAFHAQKMADLGVHKQIVNRVLEPYTYIDVLITATDFANWFALRDHKDAQPEIREVAQLMRAEYDQSLPKTIHYGEWHLPYITEDDWIMAHAYAKQDRITRDEPSYHEKLQILLKVSTARCARVSYKAFDGKVASIEKDLELYNQLLVSKPVHASPSEHQATPLQEFKLYTKVPDPRFEDPFGETEREFIFAGEPSCWSNLRGWLQYRKTIPNEYVKD